MGLFCMTSRGVHAGARGCNATLMALAVASLGMALMVFPKSASALQNVGGGYYCDVTTYDVDGEVQGWFYDNCFYMPPFWGGGHPGPDPGGYHPLPGGGGPGGGNPDPCSSGFAATEGAAHLNLLPVPPIGPGNGGGSGGSGGGCPSDGGDNNPPSTDVPSEAAGTCKSGTRPVINTHANTAFMAYWTEHIRPDKGAIGAMAPDGKVYKITFQDGSYKYYTWSRPPCNVPLTELDSTCHDG